MTNNKNAMTIGAGLLGVTGAALLGTGHVHAATNTTATVKYDNGATTVWTSPEAGQQVKRYVFKNQSFKVLGKRDVYGTTWYQVGQDEWINGKYVSVSSNSTNLVITPTYTDGAVTVWATPAYTQPTGQYLTAGQKVNAVAEHTVGHEGWYQLDNGGWVPARYVKVVNGVTNAVPLQPAQHVVKHVPTSQVVMRSAVKANVVTSAAQSVVPHSITTVTTKASASVAPSATSQAVQSAASQQVKRVIVVSTAPKTSQAASVVTHPVSVASQAQSTASQTVSAQPHFAASQTTSATSQASSAAVKPSQAVSQASQATSQTSATANHSQQVSATSNQIHSMTSQQVVVSATPKTSQAASVATHPVSVASQQMHSTAVASQAQSTASQTTNVQSQAPASQHVVSQAPASQAASSAAQHNTPVTPNHQNTTNNNTQSSAVASVIACAKAQLGKPYVSGGKGPNGFDCSGLMHYVFLHGANKEIGGWTVPQESSGTRVSLNDLQPGDLLFWGNPGNTYHDALYIGNGEYIAAPKPGDVVDVEHINSYFMPSFGVRVL